MRDRIKIAAVNDCIPARANQVAADFGISAIHGISTLVNQSHLQALLLLETDWRGTALLPMLLSSHIPIFVVEPLGDDLQYVDKIRQVAYSNELTIVPEFTTRYTPTSSRLQELLATSHGAVTKIVIDAVLPQQSVRHHKEFERHTHLLVNQFDWCQRILKDSPIRLHAKKVATNHSGKDTGLQVELIYPAKKNALNDVHVTINIQTISKKNNGQLNPLMYSIFCEEGEVIINSSTDILWTLTEKKQVHEILTSERTSTEVMLDHFCRRIVGGLLPVADLDDIVRVVKLVQIVEKSFA